MPVSATASLFRTGEYLQDALAELPNPKPTPKDKSRFGQLANLYTAFSLDFAASTIDMCMRDGRKTFADPFSGTGTLAEAARVFSINLELGDISPFAGLSGAFRSAPTKSILESAALVEKHTKKISATNEYAFFEKLFAALVASTQASVQSSLAKPSTPKNRLLSIAIYLAAVGRIRLHKRLAGSNPTWVKRPHAAVDGVSTKAAIRSTLDIARQFAVTLPDIHPGNRTRCRWASVQEFGIETGSVDVILTSPPYANRTDYVRHYLPGSELLLALAGVDERLIRTQQIGTPLIRESDPHKALTPAVLKVLEGIRTHGSYASERYYYKGFLYYFSDMFDALATMRGWLKSGGLLLMVVQDSYYKDIYIPTGALLADLAESIGFVREGRHDWPVRQSLSRLSPHSRRTLPTKTPNESIVALSK
jgi:hypothetical protein